MPCSQKTVQFDAGIKEVQKTAPFLENSSFVLLLGKLVIDVLILDGTGIIVCFHTAGADLKHPLHGDRLLGGPGYRNFWKSSVRRSS